MSFAFSVSTQLVRGVLLVVSYLVLIGSFIFYATRARAIHQKFLQLGLEENIIHEYRKLEFSSFQKVRNYLALGTRDRWKVCDITRSNNLWVITHSRREFKKGSKF